MALTHQRPVFVVLTSSGLKLARSLASRIDADIHGLKSRCPDAPNLFEDTIAHIGALFVAGSPIIGICASGILIRAVAPYLTHKTADAPLLALSDDGLNIVPLAGRASWRTQDRQGISVRRQLPHRGDDCWEHRLVDIAGRATKRVAIGKSGSGRISHGSFAGWNRRKARW